MKPPLPVERRPTLDDEEFTREFAIPGRPVVLERITQDWEARRWTPEFFRSRYGRLKVTVSRAARKTELPVTMSMDEYVRYMETTREERPWYLTSWDFTQECPELLDDFHLPPFFAEDYIAKLPDAVRPRLLWIFMGPPGSGFRMHVDVGHTAAWNAQLMGRKDWILCGPEDDDRLYQGKIDAFAPDFEKFPRYAEARTYTTTLMPGEVIFVPSRWWHQTRVLDPSVSVTGNYANRTNLEIVTAWLRAQDGMGELLSALEAVAKADCPA